MLDMALRRRLGFSKNEASAHDFKSLPLSVLNESGL